MVQQNAKPNQFVTHLQTLVRTQILIRIVLLQTLVTMFVFVVKALKVRAVRIN